MNSLSLGTAIVLSALTLPAATNFVAHGGAHRPPFSSWVDAATNLAAAIALADDGNLILISNGLYVAHLAFTNRSLSVAGQGANVTILRSGPQQPVAVCAEGSAVTFSDLMFSNNFGAGIHCYDATINVRRCSFVNGTYLDGTGLFISNSLFALASSRIQRNQAVNYGGAAVILESTGVVENTIVADNYSANFDISVGGLYVSASCVAITHSVIADNLGAGVDAFDSSVSLRNSIVWNNSCNVTAEYSCVQDALPGPGVINVDPLLTVTYHLQWNSPCIDAGTNLSTLLPDIDEEQRPQGAGPDMGADEWLSSTGDRVPDWWKTLWGFDLTSPTVWQQDPNGDGILNLDHYRLNTVPVNTNVLRILGATNCFVRALKALTNRLYVVLGTNALLGFTCETNNAPGSSFAASGATGTFLWSPSLAQIGVWSNVNFTAWDALTSITYATVVTVLPTNNAPQLASLGDLLCGEAQTLSLLVTASDPDNDRLLLVCSNHHLPGSVFQPLASGTGLFTWTPDYAAAGVYSNVFFGVFDGEFWDYEYVTITVTNSPAPPANVGLIINNGAHFTNASPVRLSLFASNAAHMAIAYDEFSLTNWIPFVPSTNWPLATLHGTNTFFARFRTAWLDESTNVSSWIIADSLAPTCVPLFPPNGYIATSLVTLTWSATDEGEAGIADFLLQTNHAIFSVATNVFTAGVAFETNWWRVVARDRAGNTSAWTEVRWYLIPEPLHAPTYLIILFALRYFYHKRIAVSHASLHVTSRKL